METQPFETDVILPRALSHLRELALNLRWTWNRETRALFREIYPDLWDRIIDNPWLVLRAASLARLKELAADPKFCERVEAAHAGLQAYMAARGWFHQVHTEDEETTIAYFTAECGLTECLPIYAGGLGVLSGDHLKAASALGIPLVGVSLLYGEGYSRQVLDTNGWQLDRYPSNAIDQMPLRLERNADGWPLLVRVPLPGRDVLLAVWRAQVGRIPLYLLDANVPMNSPADRGITAQLYGGDREMRLQQEMVLGIGGWRAITAAGHRPTVCHLNEGHAAFVVWERARHLHQETGCSFWEALAATAAGNVFTTHTPVPAGFDTFAPDLALRYFAAYAADLGLNPFDLIGLGRVEPLDGTEPLNMAVLALRHANSCNGVSKLHGAVSRAVFSAEFPRFPLEEIPITAVTNGIHTDSWISEGMERILKERLGPDVDEHPDGANWDHVRQIPDADLWDVRQQDRERLVHFSRSRLRRQLGVRGVPYAQAKERAEQTLDPNILTIGFARRFATYKRATLFLREPDRFRRMLLDPVRPIQIVIAGKAHPADDGGKGLIRDVFAFAEREDVRHRIVFLEDYDMRVTGHMVQGVDVWLNTPRRPMEASGTSGMKVLPNGGLNLSIRDGWWAEAYAPGVGWAIGDEYEDPDGEAQDARDGESLYALLEQEVIPPFYDRDAAGVPHGWLKQVKESMRVLCPEFSTNRMVRQYVDEHYLPAAARYRQLMASGMADAKSLAEWKAQVRWHWEQVRVEDATASKRGSAVSFRASVRLGPLRPEMVAVQAYAEPAHAHGNGKSNGNGNGSGHGSAPEVITLQPKGADGSVFRFEGKISSDRPAADFSLRVIPQHPKAHQPMDIPLVRWEE